MKTFTQKRQIVKRRKRYRSFGAYAYNGLCKRNKLTIFLAIMLLSIGDVCAADGSSTFKSSMGKFLGLAYTFAFIVGAVGIIIGANKKRKGDPDWMNPIIAGLIMALAVPIMQILYSITGNDALSSDTDASF